MTNFRWQALTCLALGCALGYLAASPRDGISSAAKAEPVADSELAAPPALICAPTTRIVPSVREELLLADAGDELAQAQAPRTQAQAPRSSGAAAGKKPKPGPQIKRQLSAPIGGPTTLLDDKAKSKSRGKDNEPLTDSKAKVGDDAIGGCSHGRECAVEFGLFQLHLGELDLGVDNALAAGLEDRGFEIGAGRFERSFGRLEIGGGLVGLGLGGNAAR